VNRPYLRRECDNAAFPANAWTDRAKITEESIIIKREEDGGEQHQWLLLENGCGMDKI